MSTVIWAFSSVLTAITASSESWHIRSIQRAENLVPRHDLMRLVIAARSMGSMGNESSSITDCASSSARWNARTRVVGCISRSRNGSAAARTSPARMTTEVVPSPTSSSCVRESSIMDLAAGCLTSISRRMALPSFVMTMPPMGSRIILSIARGPRQVRTRSATAFAAATLESCALRPFSRSCLVLNTITGRPRCCIIFAE
eukprot:Amastigsp_a699_1024.p4 type:complete len:201 gc:universal Amastigsp_a699_1024:1098-1700(+)